MEDLFLKLWAVLLIFVNVLIDELDNSLIQELELQSYSQAIPVLSSIRQRSNHYGKITPQNNTGKIQLLIIYAINCIIIAH